MFQLSDTKYRQLILSFFIFGSGFLSLRLLIMGSQGSTTLPQFILSALPDFFALTVLGYFFIRRKSEIGKLVLLDKIFVGFILINVILGSVISGEIKLIVYGIRMTYFPMLFYFISRFETKEFIANLIEPIFKWFSWVGIIGILLYFLFYDQMIEMILLSGGEVAEYFVTRMTSVFWTPVVFSAFMSITFIYFFWKYLNKGDKASVFYFSVSWICLLLSVSRGSLVVVILGFIIISFLSFQWQRCLTIFGIMVVSFIVVAFYMCSPMEYIKWLLSSTAETMSLKEGVSRVDIGMNAFENFREHPLGYGIGKSGHVAARFFSQNTTQADVFSTDGWFLKLANETGIIGLITYFTLAIWTFIEFLKVKFYKHQELILLFTFFAIYNVQNLVSNVFDFYLFSFLYWLLIGITINKIQQIKLSESKG